MKTTSPIILAFLAAATAQAAELPRDIIGGPDGAQTIAHCGYLATQNVIYTGSPVTTRIVQGKLQALGFNPGTIDGVYGKRSKDAVRRFQSEYGLAADGVVGAQTAQRLAYFTHSRPNVQRCWREARVDATGTR